MQKISSSLMPVVICLTAFFVGSWAVVTKYYNLSYYDWDLAFFSQAAWNLCHGSQYASLVGINYFGDHSYFFTVLILPLFAVFPHPLTLVLLKVAVFVLSAYLLYRILLQNHPRWMAVSFMVLYLIFPANVFAVLYEFNPESMAPVFLFLVYDFFRREKYFAFVVSSIFLCLIKENMLLIVFMFGLYALLSKRREGFKWGWLPMLISGSLFVALVFWLIPSMRQLQQHAFWVRYEHLLMDPMGFFSNVIVSNVGYIGDLFGPLLLAVLVAPGNLFFAAPIFAQHLMSSEYAERTIFYHYGSTLTPFIFLAAGAGVLKARQFIKGKFYNVLFVLLVAWTAQQTIAYFPVVKPLLNITGDDLNSLRWRMIHAVPPGEAVVATFKFLAPLSLRKSLYSFHMVYDQSYQDPSKLKMGELYKRQTFQLPMDVRYALIDTKDPHLVEARKVNPDLTNRKYDEFMKDWTVIHKEGPVMLLKRSQIR